MCTLVLFDIDLKGEASMDTLSPKEDDRNLVGIGVSLTPEKDGRILEIIPIHRRECNKEGVIISTYPTPQSVMSAFGKLGFSIEGTFATHILENSIIKRMIPDDT